MAGKTTTEVEIADDVFIHSFNVCVTHLVLCTWLPLAAVSASLIPHYPHT